MDGESILICNSAGTYYAVANNCTHRDSLLEKGRIRNGYISCPLHGVRFNLETGEPMGGELTKKALRTFEITEQNNNLIIRV